jgi:uncharacterized RDD family membrane protein YckC
MTAPLDTDVAIETPEHIVFHYRLAGPARRALALLLDLIICYGVVVVIATIVVLCFFSNATSDDISSAGKAGGGVVLLALFAAQWVYFVVLEATRGRSLGKQIVNLRVLSQNGRPIGWRAAAIRNLLRAADALPTGYVVGLISMTITSRFQRLGDLAAGTIVVVPESARVAKPIELSPPAHPKELATLPDAVSLDAEEREALELFLRRRHTLGRAREHELACMIAEPIARRLGFHHDDPARLLAIVYDRAVNAGRTEAPPSSWRARPPIKPPSSNGPKSSKGAPPAWP